MSAFEGGDNLYHRSTTSTADSIEIREIKAEPFYEVTIADLELLRLRAESDFYLSKPSFDGSKGMKRMNDLAAEIARRRALGET